MPTVIETIDGAEIEYDARLRVYILLYQDGREVRLSRDTYFLQFGELRLLA